MKKFAMLFVLVVVVSVVALTLLMTVSAGGDKVRGDVENESPTEVESPVQTWVEGEEPWLTPEMINHED